MKNKLRHIIKEEINILFEEKEEIFVPHNLEGRKEKRLQQTYRILQQKHIEGDLDLSGIITIENSDPWLLCIVIQ